MAGLKFRLIIPLFTAGLAFPQSTPIQIHVDATDAPRRLLHATLQFPVKPGPTSLLYPKWIPGEHGPTGPIEDLAGIKITANGKPLPWHRDDVNIYEFHIDVPPGVTHNRAPFHGSRGRSSDSWHNRVIRMSQTKG